MKRSIFCFICLTLCCIGQVQAEDAGILARGEEKGAYASVEARRLGWEAARSHEARLGREHAELVRKKRELKILEALVEQKIAQLRQERLALEQLLAQKDAARQKRLKNLARIYENMAADRAAVLLGRLDQGLTIELLSRMSSRSAARILAYMDQDEALHFSKELSRIQ